MRLQMRNAFFLAILMLAACDAMSQTELAQTMAMTTPWGQAKLTDAAGIVSYRVGAVFSEPGSNPKRLSFTFLCQPGQPAGKLSLFTVHQHVSKSGGPSARIGLQVDAQPVQRAEAARQSGNGLTSYVVSSASDAEALAKAMDGGGKLRLALDEFAYELPLAGIGDALRELSAACPHG